jgi:nitrate reductase NapD
MSLSRRSLLGGEVAVTTHIASLVVHCRPESLAGTRAAIEALPNIEVPASDERGKLVVLMEMTDESELLGGISRIEATEGVICATLAFHQVDEL